MLKNIVTRSINPQQKLLNIMLQITGATITIVSLMWFGLNSQMAHLNNRMITMDNQLVIMSSLDTQVLKHINTIVVAMYLTILMLKMRFTKRTLQWPPMIGVKVVLTMVGACQMHCSTICIILKRLYMMQSLKTNYHVKRLVKSLAT